jgi:hypothetical protein
MQLIPDVCDATGVSFEARDLQCITDACIPRRPELP